MADDKIREAIAILAALGLPKQQQNKRSGLTLLALANLSPKDAWSNAKPTLLRTVDIMAFMEKRYKKKYAPNSRETIRRQTLHQFEQARLVDRNPDDPKRPTNSGNTAYQLTPEAMPVLQSYGTARWAKYVAAFARKIGALKEEYAKKRDLLKIPVKLADGSTVTLSPGEHNVLQAKVVTEFAQRFAQDAVLLYCGDTSAKSAILHEASLKKLNIPFTEHDKLPDLILYEPRRNWLYLIEAVTTHGPVTPKRYKELELMLAHCKAERIYVTAFHDASTFRRYAADIAWETEVWIAENPDHMIHFNGAKFLGPYRSA